MSFTSVVKKETVIQEFNETEILALLSGFIRNNGSYIDDLFTISSENEDIINFLKKYLSKYFNLNIIESKVNGINLTKKKLVLLQIKDSEKLIDSIGFNNETVPDYIIDGNSEIRNYLKGVFLSSGSVNDPNSSYHLELTIQKKEEVILVQKLLNIFDLNAKILERNKGYMVYLKEAEKISDFLKILNTNKAVLFYEDVRVLHDKKNEMNRLNNCEQANTDKVIATSEEQLKDIKLIEDKLGLEVLDDKTKVVIEYRKKYPESSYSELANIISIETKEKLTKSGLSHRFRKIKEIADRLKEDK